MEKEFEIKDFLNKDHIPKIYVRLFNYNEFLELQTKLEKYNFNISTYEDPKDEMTYPALATLDYIDYEDAVWIESEEDFDFKKQFIIFNFKDIKGEM